MSNMLFTVRKLVEMALLGKFYSSDSSALSRGEKLFVCRHLNLSLEDDIEFFGPTGYSMGEAIIGRKPDLKTDSGRSFWIYGPDEQLP
jgi:hypothetical protein